MRSRLQPGERVAIYGAGDGGELAVRELLNNPALGLKPFCFVDDNPLKLGERIHGLPVLGGLDHLAAITAEHGVRRVLIATKKLRGPRLQALHAAVARLGVELLELEISMRSVRRNGEDRRVARVKTRRVVENA
jgi:UDP-GlcNAc:undecaprenyl-phosphate GlcNAc-1-phosphate transferase